MIRMPKGSKSGHSFTAATGELHFMHVCDECAALTLARCNLDQVENMYNTGRIRQALYEAYTHLWATTAVRYGSYGSWTVPPTDPETVALVRMLRTAFEHRQASKKH